jgi:hypothetical protein
MEELDADMFMHRELVGVGELLSYRGVGGRGIWSSYEESYVFADVFLV